MKLFDVQGIEIEAPRDRVFEFIRKPENLPHWAHAFTSVKDQSARMETPAGAVDVRLDTQADSGSGTVDWRMEFPDGSVGTAESRVTETSRATSIYSFVLHAPPVSLERVEGALDAQRITLQSELATLKRLLEQ